MAKVDFKFNDGSKIFLTSDSHFCHDNIRKFCHRPFNSLEEMDYTMVENWNNVVPPDGLVFHLGDFAWGGYPAWRSIREKLNGKIILIKGNHDRKNITPTGEQTLFEHVAQQMFVSIEGRKIYLNHLPLLCFDGTYRDENGLIYNLFGHVHLSNHTERNTGRDFKRCVDNLFPTQYDVGVDFNDFTPISWKELNAKIQFQIKNNVNLSYWLDKVKNE